jgi:hypothetical protein
VAEVLVRDWLALGVVATRICKTPMCKNTVKALGLPVEHARGLEFGTYQVLVGMDVNGYVKVIRGPVTIKFSETIKF